jgi:hypothetical protein
MHALVSTLDLPDPRTWSAEDASVPLQALRAGLDAPTGDDADAQDATVRRWLRRCIDDGQGDALARAFAQAPSYALARHLRRLVAEVERTYVADDALRTTLFAVPLVAVTALEDTRPPVVLPGVLADTGAIAAVLRRGRTFGGCDTFALARAAVATPSIDLTALPALLARSRLAEMPADRDAPSAALAAPLDLSPAPIRVDTTEERVHLRFVVGAILTPPRVDPLARAALGREGIAFARAVGDALKAPGVSLLALPRPPQRLALAVAAGRAAQREVSAQLFASNAIRRLRATYGEPTAIVSAHRAQDAVGGGELRLSVSSPFAPKAAEGYRCPVYADESVHDVAAMLESLLRDCQVSDIRVLGGVHDDVDPATGQRLFFKNQGTDSQLH